MNTLEVQDFNFKLSQVKKSIAEAEIGKGLVNIKGKIYSTVGLRITKLREHFGIAISTEFISASGISANDSAISSALLRNCVSL